MSVTREGRTTWLLSCTDNLDSILAATVHQITQAGRFLDPKMTLAAGAHT